MDRKGVILYNYTCKYDSFANFMYDNWNTVFRYLIYKRQYTPYEQDKKFTDESIYEDIFYKEAYIRHCIYLPDGDILIGFLDAEYSDEEDLKHIEFCKLSEIRLVSYSADQEDEEEDECNDDSD